MTELQQQVQSHRKKHGIVASNISSQKHQPSLFLSPSQAAAVDIAKVLDTAQDSLQTLAQYDSRFSKYLSTLLHPSSVELQRDLKTPQV
jgi:DNA integrity scanning protein DisA with diadenylate cyclase activity